MAPQSFAQVVKKLLQEEFHKQDEKFEKMEGKIGQLDDKMGHLEEKIEHLEEKVDNYRQEVVGFKADVMGEVQTMRDELTVALHQYERSDNRLTRVEKYLHLSPLDV